MSGPGGLPLPSNPAEDDSRRILGATLTVTSVALITYLARMYVRLILVHNAGIDDYFMTLAVGLAVSGQGVVWGSVAYGAGKHIGDIPLEYLSTGLKLNFISQPIYLIAICVVKLAVGSMLLRIASTPFYKRLIIAVMSFMAVWTTVCLLTLLLQCSDIRALWDPTIVPNCWGEETLHGLSYSNLTLSILTDLAFALFIPAPMLWNLNVNRRTRLSLLGALGLGCFACAAAFVKIPSLVNYGKEGDWLWDSREITIWTIVECNIGIVAANLPTLRPIFKRILGTSVGAGSYSGNAQKASSYWHQKSGGSSGLHSMGTSKKSGISKPSAPDETSSERAFNAASSYEMGGRAYRGNQSIKVSTNEDGLSSDESVNWAGRHQGITRKTTTTVNYGIATTAP